MNKKILVIDDNDKLCKSLEVNFRQLGYNYHSCSDGKTSLDYLNKSDTDFILLDLALGKEDGLQVLSEIKKLKPFIPIVMITGFGSINSAVDAMKIGAVDYVQKPLLFPHLLKIVENHIHKPNSRENLFQNGIITRSNVMITLLEKAGKLAETDFPILLTGESGTGKERIAHFIHQSSKRSSKDMLCINCAAFPEHLLDNELFGHDKGAYTGADQLFKGIFERADSGTLFMDEIGDMSFQTQAKILRTLQNNEIRRIGGNSTKKINVRFIGATNKDLSDLMSKKRFREDLYYRLNTAVIHIPPLRERKEDIIPLAEYFLKENFEQKKLQFSSEAINILLHYQWPGNIRELRNAVHYAGALASGDEISAGDLPQDLNQADIIPNRTGSLEDYEKALILKALKQASNNKRKTAEILNISRKTLYNKLDKYGIVSE